jgi:hypothetical protein
MATKDTSVFSPETVIPQLKGIKQSLLSRLLQKKKLVIAAIIILIAFFALNIKVGKKTEPVVAKSINVTVDRSFTMTALSNQGKPTGSKARLKIASAEKTDQVMVKDQVFTAKNHKLFLILNLELKNDETSPVNLIPGDLMRLTISGDEENKFAPDLHNNLVLISAISTKTDRIGFVIPDNARTFKLYVGELEGKKETVTIGFPS